MNTYILDAFFYFTLGVLLTELAHIIFRETAKAFAQAVANELKKPQQPNPNP